MLVHEDGSLSQFQFVSVFRKGIQVLGLEDSIYSAHSFHIGAATDAASLVLIEDVIKRIGHWESAHFWSYVQLHRVYYGVHFKTTQEL